MGLAMTHAGYERKFNAAAAELRGAGIWRDNAIPLHFKIARKLGFELRPHFYESFAKVVIVYGVNFAVSWGFLMHIMIWRGQARPVLVQIITSVLTGMFYGFGMAFWMRRMRTQKGLSAWDDL
jgi:hypothetical protein